jgi:hypothetical protein
LQPHRPLCRGYDTAREVVSISYAVLRIFGPLARIAGWPWRCKMAHLITSDDKYRDLTYDDAYRSYLITRTDSPYDYRFGRTQGKRIRVHARSALRRLNGYFRNMIEAIASSKLRRMERELKLRDVRLDRLSNDWVVRTESTERSR